MRLSLILLTIALLLACIGPSFAEQRAAYLDPSLPVATRVKDLISRMTLEEKISQLVVPSAAIPRLGMPEYDWRGECLHGLLNGNGVTCFPQSIGMGATFDSDLIYQVATAISDEALAQHYYLAKQGKSTFGNNFTYWSPNINLYRDPRWGRGQETYGEDPYLISVMGVNFIKGLQGNDPKYLKVASVPKHYAVHSGPDEIRMHFSATANPHDFWDTYMPQFEAAVVEGKAAGIMAAYSGINGAPCHANYTLLNTILRKTWGFDGFVVSDGLGVYRLLVGQEYTKDAADTAKVALEAGIDLENQLKYYSELIKLVKDGVVLEKRVDEALANLLTIRFRVGMFDPSDMVPYTKLPYSLVGSPEHRSLALKAAQESIVLLKNGGVLPIEKGKYKKIAVIGPAGEFARDLYGNYFAGKPTKPVSILQGINYAVRPVTEVVYSKGCYYSQSDAPNMKTIPAEMLVPTNVKPGQRGLLGEYFNNMDLKGEPALTRVDRQIDMFWGMNGVGSGMPPAHFSIRWTGKFKPTVSGYYDLVLLGVDGARLYIDGKCIIDRWQQSTSCPSTYPIEIQAGSEYDIKVEYYERERGARVRLALAKREKDDALISQAMEAAKDADLIIAAVGIRSDMAGEARDWSSYALPATQQKLLEAMKTTGKPMVLVLIGGNALDLTWEQQNADAILQAWFPGEEGGTAVADVLFGKYNPSGRLPVTYYKSIEQLPDAADYSMKSRTYRYFTEEVLYPFGYGLSYTSFAYNDLVITPTNAQTNGKVEVTAKVTNKGSEAGDEVAQLYVSSDNRSDYAPVKQLRGIQRVSLKPGETKVVHFTLTPKDFALVDERGDLKVDPGSYTISVGGKQPGVKSIAQAVTTGVVSSKVVLVGSINYLAKDRPFPK